MELLRSKGKVTRMLLLLRIVLDTPPDQRSLSEALSMTQQAASLYMKDMEREGLVERTKKGPRATVHGVEVLQRDLLALKGFVDSSIMSLEIIRSTDAVARGRVRKGDRCTLIMEDGVLTARVGADGPSTGTADMDAEDGCMVPISGLSGVMELKQGVLHLVEVRPVRLGGGSDRIRASEVPRAGGRKGGGGRRVAALDMEAMALLRRSGIRCDLELPHPEDVKGSLLRGLDVVAFGTPHSISKLRASLGGFPERVVERKAGTTERKVG